MTNEDALMIIEHAIDYLSTRGYPDDGILIAVGILIETHKAIGSYGQTPSWENVQ